LTLEGAQQDNRCCLATVKSGWKNVAEPSKPESEKWEEFGRKVGRELGEIVNYIDKDVVPTVREHSTQGLRTAAEKLLQLAEYMEKHKPPSS
jgi:hypothetical protein